MNFRSYILTLLKMPKTATFVITAACFVAVCPPTLYCPPTLQASACPPTLSCPPTLEILFTQACPPTL